PFFLYCLGFLLALFLYSWNWSNIYPVLSFHLIIFLVSSFIPMILAGIILEKNKNSYTNITFISVFSNDLCFILILFLGLLDVLLMGYIPFFNRSIDYRKFGAPVVDVLFNTLSIFFSLLFLQSFLVQKRNRLLIYFFIIIAVQVFLFRRSTIVWISVSALLMLAQYKKKLSLYILALLVISLPLLSYVFGFMGNYRSNITHEEYNTKLGVSEKFDRTGLSQNHYMTYLYISSPLANLQKNVESEKGFVYKQDYIKFFFYCIAPASLTMRMEKRMNIYPPEPSLITPWLIVGTCFMLSYLTMGWMGMIIMAFYIFTFIVVTLLCIRKWNSFSLIGLSLLSTAASLLIFDNILNRLDIVMMVFLYPLGFHFINKATMKLGKVHKMES
ncbi:MAG: hypothetical protein ABSA76_00005, partial [Bacteroidales bacterium]